MLMINQGTANIVIFGMIKASVAEDALAFILSRKKKSPIRRGTAESVPMVWHQSVLDIVQ